MSGKRDQPNILNTVGVWNGNIFYLAAPIPISPKFRFPTLHKGVSDFTFVVGTRVEKETNQLCLIL